MSDNRISPERTGKAQREADSAHSPGPEGCDPNETPRGGMGDARPDRQHDPRTRGGEPPEAVEDRPAVSEVNPYDYPSEDRRDGDVTGGAAIDRES